MDYLQRGYVRQNEKQGILNYPVSLNGTTHQYVAGEHSYSEGTVWSHTQYSVSGHLIKDKSGLIRRSFTKLLTPHQKSWFTSFVL